MLFALAPAKPFMADLLDVLLMLAVLIVGAAFYLLPTIVAVFRNHPRTTPIAVVNIVLGWTLVAYAIALAWLFLPTDHSHLAAMPDQPGIDVARLE